MSDILSFRYLALSVAYQLKYDDFNRLMAENRRYWHAYSGLAEDAIGVAIAQPDREYGRKFFFDYTRDLNFGVALLSGKARTNFAMAFFVYKIEPYQVFSIRSPAVAIADDNRHLNAKKPDGLDGFRKNDEVVNRATALIDGLQFDLAAEELFRLIQETDDSRAYELLRPIVSKTREWTPSDQEWLNLVNSVEERGDVFRLMAAVSVFTGRSLQPVWENVLPTLTDQEVRIYGEELAIALRLQDLRRWGERIEMWQSFSTSLNDKLLGSMEDEQIERWIAEYKASPSKHTWLPLRELVYAYARLGRAQDSERIISIYSRQSSRDVEWLQLSAFRALIRKDIPEAERLYRQLWIDADVTALPKLNEVLLLGAKGREALETWERQIAILHGYPSMAADVFGILAVYPHKDEGRSLLLNYLSKMDYGVVLKYPKPRSEFLRVWREYGLTTEEMFSGWKSSTR